MTDQEQSYRSLVKSIHNAQRKHEALLGKVEKTTARLERRKAKLHSLEARIADLERSLAEPHRQHAGIQAASDDQLKPAQLIFNPASGVDDGDSAIRLAHIDESLRAHGIRAQIGIKTTGKAARAMAQEAVRSGLPLVIVAAGDGTIEEVAAQLIGSSTALGIIPIGTMNNLARSLGIPLEIEDACALIGMGTVRHIDLGRVFSNDSSQVEYFLESAGVGLGSLAMLAGQAVEKRRWHVVPGALRRMFTSSPGTIKVEMDDVTLEASTSIVTVSNAPLMGKNLLIAPEARMDDGLLDVAVYDGMGDAALMKHLQGISNGNTEKLPSYRSRRVCITSVGAVEANADKDVTAQRKVLEIEIVPRALSVIVGNGIGLSVPVASAPDAPTFAVKPQHANPPADEGHAENAPPEG
jgi:diacylglycerol kinase (ATP)